jgi:hypothetical protein
MVITDLVIYFITVSFVSFLFFSIFFSSMLSHLCMYHPSIGRKTDEYSCSTFCKPFLVLGVSNAVILLNKLHHALHGDLSSFVAEFLKDNFHFPSRNAVFGSNVDQDTLHAFHTNAIRFLVRSSGTHNVLLEARRHLLCVAVARRAERRSVSNLKKKVIKCHHPRLDR